MQDLNDKIQNGGATADGILTADEWNQVPSEIQNVIESTGQTLSGANLKQLVKGIAAYSSVGNFYTGGGIANAYTANAVAPLEAPAALYDGMQIRLIISADNTGASTLNAFSTGVIDIKLRGGITDPEANALLAGKEYTFIYRTAPSDHWEVFSADARIININTVNDMIADNSLIIGDVVQTLGYNTIGDNGSNLYEIVASGTGVDDGGSYIDLPTSGNQAKGIFPNKVNVKQFGAVGDGIVDDTSAIQATLDYAKSVCFPDGDYLITSTLTTGTLVAITALTTGSRKANIKVENGINAIDLDNFTTISDIGFISNLSGTVTASNIAIKCHGTYNSGLSPTYKEGIYIKNCRFIGWGNDSIDLKYVRNFEITDNKMANNARSFIEIITGIDGVISRNDLSNIATGVAGDSYGIIVTRDATTSSLVDNPRSERVIISDNNIVDNPTYVGINTHAGNYITIDNNVIKNCRVPIDVVSSSFGGTDDHASNYVTVTNNVLEGTDQDPCIRLVPGAFGAVGAPTDESFGCVVTGNVCSKGGSSVDTLTGAILVQDTTNAIVANNSIINANRYGILLYHTNKNINVSDNSIIDPFHDSFTVPAGIHVNDDYNTGIISGNVITRDDTALATYVCERGIWTNTGKANNAIPVNNNWAATATTPYVLDNNPGTAVNF